MTDLMLKNASLPDGRSGMDIAISGGRITAVSRNIGVEAGRVIELDGWLVSPPFVNPHFHLDATLAAGRPRHNLSGTLLEGIDIWGELSPTLTVEDIYDRSRELCLWAIAKGCLAIRSHVDITDSALLAVDALVALRSDLAPWIDLQLVAFPQFGYYRHPDARENVIRALDRGLDIVGGIPHFERTMSEGDESVADLCRIAADRGLMVDMHCDETDDPNSRHVERLAAETHRLGLQGRVVGSHLTSMHSMDNYYVSKLLPMILESGMGAVANPLINMVVQGRHDNYPKRRGLTRIREMTEAGIPVALGHDCVMDPWYSLGTHDMLEVAQMTVHACHMTGRRDMESIYDGITTTGARVMQLEGYGIEPGCNADLVVLQARSPIEAIRLRAQPLHVLRRGKVIAESVPHTVQLTMDGEARSIDFMLRPDPQPDHSAIDS